MDLNRYPRFKKFLSEHPGMSFDEAFEFIELKYKKLEGDVERDRQSKAFPQ